MDDILITGKDEDEHHNNLNRVLRRLQEVGVKLNPSKFHFMMDEISYLGHTISSAGVAPTADKIEAMRDAKAPSNVYELQSFIGTANFLRRFIPHFAWRFTRTIWSTCRNFSAAKRPGFEFQQRRRYVGPSRGHSCSQSDDVSDTSR